MLRLQIDAFVESIMMRLMQFVNAQQKPIFILGCGHSGTTLMYSILSSHPNVYGVATETSIFYHPSKYIQQKAFIKYRLLALLSLKQNWVEKTPRHIHKLADIFRVFPKCKVVFMVRDGRDTILSLRKRFGDFEYSLNRWIHDNEAILPFLDKKNVIVIKLEELTSKPVEAVHKVCSFLALPYTSSMLDFHLGSKGFFKDNYTPEEIEKMPLGLKSHHILRNLQLSNPIKPVLSRWLDELSEEEIKRIHKSAAHLLRLFNYPIGNDQ